MKTPMSVSTNITYLLNTPFGSSQLTNYYYRYKMPDLLKHVSYLVRESQDTQEGRGLSCRRHGGRVGRTKNTFM